MPLNGVQYLFYITNSSEEPQLVGEFKSCKWKQVSFMAKYIMMDVITEIGVWTLEYLIPLLCKFWTYNFIRGEAESYTYWNLLFRPIRTLCSLLVESILSTVISAIIRTYSALDFLLFDVFFRYLMSLWIDRWYWKIKLKKSLFKKP